LECFLYYCMMYVIEVSTGKKIPIEILAVETTDYSIIKKSRFFFNWKAEQHHENYKLVLSGQQDILGLISIERIPAEWRIHIRLLTVSVENKGNGKIYDRIIGNLLAFVASQAIRLYGELACISLRPKTAIAQHYINKYNMNSTGMTLSLEVPEIIDLINQYNHEG
jgi:hypothetical protein